MLTENSMVSFNNFSNFYSFYEDLNIYSPWRITDAPINERGELVRNACYINTFRRLFNEKHLFRRAVSIGELVSFTDNYYLFKKVIDELKNILSAEEFNKFSLFSEYRIKMSKNRRIDFILVYKTKVLLLEFRISNTFPNISNIWQRKEAELLIYKELLKNYISREYNLLIYAFIGMPEYDKKQPIPKHIKYNEDNVAHLAKYIKQFMVEDPQITISWINDWLRIQYSLRP